MTSKVKKKRRTLYDLPFGKYRGKSVEWLVLNKPDYVKWVLEEPTRPGSALASAKAEALRLISIFDAKPILKPCSGSNCSRTAIRFTGYQGNSYTLYEWCETCDPYELSGAVEWKLTVIRTYKDALNFIKEHCDGRGYRLAINAIAMAKGFPERSSPARIKKFFGEDVKPDEELKRSGGVSLFRFLRMPPRFPAARQS